MEHSVPECKIWRCSDVISDSEDSCRMSSSATHFTRNMSFRTGHSTTVLRIHSTVAECSVLQPISYDTQYIPKSQTTLNLLKYSTNQKIRYTLQIILKCVAIEGSRTKNGQQIKPRNDDYPLKVALQSLNEKSFVKKEI